MLKYPNRNRFLKDRRENVGSLQTKELEREFTFFQLFKTSQHFTALLFGQIFSLLGS